MTLDNWSGLGKWGMGGGGRGWEGRALGWEGVG